MFDSRSGLRVAAFETLSRLGGVSGSSDHCPLWCELSRVPAETGEVFQVQDAKGDVEEVRLGKPPFCDMYLSGSKEACLLDTGSAWTILNPAKNETDETDAVFKTFEVLG